MKNRERGSVAKGLLTLVVGLGLAMGGFYLSINPPPFLEFQHGLNEQGIPIDLGKTIAMIGMFIVLFPVLKTFYFKPLGDAIHNRTSELERTFTEAEELRAEMTQMRSDYEKRLQETEASARAEIQAQIREAKALADARINEVNANIDEMRAKAQAEIEREKNRVVGELRLAVVDLTLSATERVLGENVDSAKNRKLVTEFIDKVEVPS